MTPRFNHLAAAAAVIFAAGCAAHAQENQPAAPGAEDLREIDLKLLLQRYERAQMNVLGYREALVTDAPSASPEKMEEMRRDLKIYEQLAAELRQQYLELSRGGNAPGAVETEAAAATEGAVFPDGTFSRQVAEGRNMTVAFGGHGEVIVTMNGEPFVTAEYLAEGSEIQFIDRDGAGAVEGSAAGIYNWRLEGDSLVFEAVRDDHERRRAALTSGPWEKAEAE